MCDEGRHSLWLSATDLRLCEGLSSAHGALCNAVHPATAFADSGFPLSSRAQRRFNVWLVRPGSAGSGGLRG